MALDVEIHEFLLIHLQAVQDNDLETYRVTSAEDLAVYEWWLTPHRIDGLPYDEFMIIADANRQAPKNRKSKLISKWSNHDLTLLILIFNSMAILPLQVTHLLLARLFQMVSG